jgi:hypothetical protein
MRLHVSAAALLLALAGSASAQDGGKLPWRGKSDDPRAVLADAKREWRPMMLFFTSAG